MEKTIVIRTTYMQTVMTETYSQGTIIAVMQGKLAGSWERAIAERIRQDYHNDHPEACEIIESVKAPGMSANTTYLKAAYLITSSVTAPNLINELCYSSYAANRDAGMTHEQLVVIGVGDSDMKEKYETGTKDPDDLKDIRFGIAQ